VEILFFAMDLVLAEKDCNEKLEMCAQENNISYSMKSNVRPKYSSYISV